MAECTARRTVVVTVLVTEKEAAVVVAETARVAEATQVASEATVVAKEAARGVTPLRRGNKLHQSA